MSTPGFVALLVAQLVAAGATGWLMVSTLARVLGRDHRGVRDLGVSLALVVVAFAVPFQFPLFPDELGRSVALYVVAVAVACFVCSVASGQQRSPERSQGE